jgi:hypothetical protein
VPIQISFNLIVFARDERIFCVSTAQVRSCIGTNIESEVLKTAADQPLFALDGVKSVMKVPLSVADLTNSVFELVKSVNKVVKSVSEVVKSVSEVVKSVSEVVKSVSEVVKSDDKVPFSVTKVVKSVTEVPLFFMEVVKSETDLTNKMGKKRHFQLKKAKKRRFWLMTRPMREIHAFFAMDDWGAHAPRVLVALRKEFDGGVEQRQPGVAVLLFRMTPGRRGARTRPGDDGNLLTRIFCLTRRANVAKAAKSVGLASL